MMIMIKPLLFVWERILPGSDTHDAAAVQPRSSRRQRFYLLRVVKPSEEVYM